MKKLLHRLLARWFIPRAEYDRWWQEFQKTNRELGLQRDQLRERYQLQVEANAELLRGYSFIQIREGMTHKHQIHAEVTIHADLTGQAGKLETVQIIGRRLAVHLAKALDQPRPDHRSIPAHAE